ncbi:nicotinate (nicotinamide) nucleotide adenylyltransferase [Thermosipho ferrireducens]|uniref:Probable nicotinate-nucleotide adenylyltransferase n=1 Tax=Thermosipho ferrireducens TaxID=2571116 RepID=A0ABX7S886_9BACT|nr:nicotinate (nicotinamide) nucleotide adenylyltransferase [Thermosipho ferrireducens]QTA38809.1 nicotinate (nicotinamide) nucleotide adenylyltransferase [Thermosipho ferrireducens]
MAIQFGLPEELLNLENSLIIFGGSFNPPHNGHVMIANLVIELFKGMEFHIVPSATPPHKKVSIEFLKRYEMARIAFSKIKGVKVVDTEYKLGGISYAVNTVNYYKKFFDNIFYLVGEDALASIEKWYKYEELLKKVIMIVYPRYKDESLVERANSVLGELAEKIYMLDLPIIQISSTFIRDRVKKGLSVYGFVPESIIPIVEEVYKKSAR